MISKAGKFVYDICSHISLIGCVIYFIIIKVKKSFAPFKPFVNFIIFVTFMPFATLSLAIMAIIIK